MNAAKPTNIFLLLLIVALPGFSNSQDWSPLATGMDSNVTCFAVYKGQLYAGGYFSHAGGINTHHIARWNGSHWDSVGSGTNKTITAMAVYNDKLFVGGAFTLAGGRNANYIACWNDTAWDTVCNGMRMNFSLCPTCDSIGIFSMAVYNNKLFIGGLMDTIYNLPVNYIAAWNETIWNSLGRGLYSWNNQPWPDCMAVFNNELYIGGAFDSAGGILTESVARWNDTIWDSLSNNITNGSYSPYVYSLSGYNGLLYAGGNFLQFGNLNAEGLATWNGSNWNAIPGFGSGGIQAIMPFNNSLIAGGIINLGSYENAIAKFDGLSWDSIGAGLTGLLGYVGALADYDSTLFAGGYFNESGETHTNYIAQWVYNTGTKNLVDPEKLAIYPNPNKGKFTLAISNNEQRIMNIEVYNTLGQKVYSSFNIHGSIFDVQLNSKSDGVYLYRILQEDGTLIGEGKMVIEH